MKKEKTICSKEAYGNLKLLVNKNLTKSNLELISVTIGRRKGRTVAAVLTRGKYHFTLTTFVWKESKWSMKEIGHLLKMDPWKTATTIECALDVAADKQTGAWVNFMRMVN